MYSGGQLAGWVRQEKASGGMRVSKVVAMNAARGRWLGELTISAEDQWWSDA